MDRLTARQMDFLIGVFGREKVNAGESARDLHCRDFSGHPCRPPAVVVWPQTTDQVCRLLEWADGERVPVTPWGAGTSIEGNPIPVAGGVVADMNDMNRILNFWPDDMQVEVEPGVGYKDLNHKLRHDGLFFPPDPGAWATIGGMIANNASGVRTVKYGATRDYVQTLEIVLPGGRVIETGTRARKSSSGYDLTRFFVGSEGTLGIVTRAVIRLAGLPEHVLAVVAGFPSTLVACRTVNRIVQSGADPAAMELLTVPMVKLLKRENDLDLPETPILFMEFHGFSSESLGEVLAVVREICDDFGAVSFESGLGRENRDRIWSARYEAAETIKRVHAGLEIVITDAAVPVSAYPDLVTYSSDLVERENLIGYVFGHAGDGNLHLVWMGDPADQKGWSAIERANGLIVEKALSLGGTATGEHGVGIGKRRFMDMEHGESVQVMRQFKQTIDPNNIMNPGKLLP